ncbi:hypothetical protein PIB30_118419 [Stylosanthes scabra]|uniref:Secreted protein n=1 Tax=Stylosanthes scabra TaxID=79078 RepID=A0ABU6V6P1_9FABA|nr:hypothetical protein [Stylosanthes scabra]
MQDTIFFVLYCKTFVLILCSAPLRMVLPHETQQPKKKALRMVVEAALKNSQSFEGPSFSLGLSQSSVEKPVVESTKYMHCTLSTSFLLNCKVVKVLQQHAF